MLPSPPTLILLEASRSTSKSVDPVQTRTEAISPEEVGCVVAVEATRAVLEAVREGAIEVTIEQGAEVRLRPHDSLVKYSKQQNLSTTKKARARSCCSRSSHQSNPPTSLSTPDLDPQYRKESSRRIQYDFLTLTLSSIAICGE